MHPSSSVLHFHANASMEFFCYFAINNQLEISRKMKHISIGRCVVLCTVNISISETKQQIERLYTASDYYNYMYAFFTVTRRLPRDLMTRQMTSWLVLGRASSLCLAGTGTVSHSQLRSVIFLLKFDRF